MLNALFFMVIGVFIGWNFPQPEYAKFIQKMVMKKWEDFKKSKNING